VGNSKHSRPEAVRNKRKQRTKTKGKTLVIRCASLRWLRGQAQNPHRRPEPLSPGCIQCHCPSAVCGPRSRMSPRYGRQDKSAIAETHRIEESVAALYPLITISKVGARRTHVAYPLYCYFLPEEILKVSGGSRFVCGSVGPISRHS
jgi:hypothetical protein